MPFKKDLKTLFIGGGATNDGGIGMQATLGYQFYDSANESTNPIGKSLKEYKQD
jgi:glycerate kinase